MAVSKQAMRNAIAGYQKQGLGGRQILIALSKRKDDVGKTYNAAINAGVSQDEIAQTFGIKLSKGKTAGEVNKNATLADKAKSWAESAGMGLADTGAGIIQGVAWLGDKANERINSTFGTNLETHAYDKYNKEYKIANDTLDINRQQAGRGGGDWVRGATTMAATAPAFVKAGAMTVGKGLATRAAAQAGAGAIVGAANYAENAKERGKNILGGAIGGAAGEVGGYALGKGATKIYNATKGNLAPDYNPIAQLGKQYDVPVSAGDIMRNPIIEKAEVLSENAPIVGMAGYREAQHNAAKNAAEKVVTKLDDALTKTDYKAIDKIQTAAANGDRNANRVLSIVNNADTPDKIIQASMEVRQFREKSVASKLYDAVGEKLKGLSNTTVSPIKTKTILEGKIDELSKSLAPDDTLARDLANIKANFDNPNVATDFNNMRLLRSQLGDLAEKYAQGSNPNKSASKFFGDMRQAVESDISDFVASTGNSEIKTAYQRADKYYKGMVERQDRSFAKAMDSNTPDEIYSKFISVGKGDRAQNFYNALDQKGQAAVRLKMAEDALSKATNESTGHFSPAKFAGEFERLSEPYGKVFSGADKQEMDGFVKLMRHVERAGQYMENPPTGNRLVGVAMGGTAMASPALALQGAGVTALAKTLFTSKAGKNLLMAANKLDAGSTGMANVLKAVETVMAASGANMGVDSSQDTPSEVPTTDAPVVEEVINPTQTESVAPQNIEIPVGGAMPMSPDYQQQAASPQAPVIEQTQIEPISQTAQPVMPVGLPMPPPAPAESAPIDGSQPTDAPVNASEHIGQSLASLIPQPIDTTDARKMAAYAQITQQAVGAVLQTPPMQQISMELETAEPNEQKIRYLQKELSKTPEWQSFINTLPKEERQQMSSADVLSLITRNVSSDTNVSAPQF